MAASTERLKALALEAGLTQKEVAQVTGLSESAVSRLFSGETERALSLPEAEAVLSAIRARTGRRRGLTLNDLVADGERGAA